jgi:cyclic pyranopterin phosphate synthase
MSTVRLAAPRIRSAGDAEVDPARPDDGRLVDRFGRVATDLRVSLTDKCNLRCSYCMPAEGLDWLADERLLSDTEVIRLVQVAVERLGVEEVRFTGGEPLLRKGLEKIVEAASSLTTASGVRVQTMLTTNALGLARRATGLASAGLDRINVSLDTLDPERFVTITHRDRLHDVLAGCRAAADAGLSPVKINTVLLRGVNDSEAPALVRWALDEGYELRFIEQMPLDAQGAWDRTTMVTAEEILASLEAELDLEHTDPASRGASPAETWWVRSPGSPEPRGLVGIVASVTRPFCGDCDRTRLTADGQMRDCLFAQGETDLRSLLRSGASDEEIAAVWRQAMWRKRPGHGIDDEGFLQPTRPMSAIGG